MGLFSSKKRTVIQSTAQRMLDDSGFKYAHKLAVGQWIWDTSGINLDKQDLSHYIFEYTNNSLPKKFNKLLNYSKSKDRFGFGLPTSQITTDPQNQLKKVLNKYLINLENKQIQLIRFLVDTDDLYFESWFKLINEFGYDTKSNEITKLSKQYKNAVYLKNAYLKLSDRTNAEYKDMLINNSLSFSFNKIYDTRDVNITRPQTNAVINTDDDKDYLVLDIVYKTYDKPDYITTNQTGIVSEYVDDIETIHEDTLLIDISSINPLYTVDDKLPKNNDTIYAVYLVDDEYKFFKYVYQSGGIEVLDNALTTHESIGLYYPRLHIRTNQTDTLNYTDKKLARDLTKAFKRIGLDAKQITQQLHKSIGDNYHDCRGIFIHIGANINQTNKDSVSEYCYNYFERLYKTQGKKIPVLSKQVKKLIGTEYQITYVEDETKNRKSGILQNIKDNFSDLALVYDWIEFKEHTGQFIYKGKKLNKDEYCIVFDVFTGDNSTQQTNKFIHKLVKQIDDNTYHTIEVCELSQTVIMSGYHATHKGSDDNLVIPVDSYLVKHLDNKEKQVFFHKCLYIQIMFVKVIKTKWYQRGIFKALITVIGIAISIAISVHGGATFGQALLKGVIGAVKGYAVSKGVQLLSKVATNLGLSQKIINKLSFVVSIVVAIRTAKWDFSKLLTAPNIMKAINHSFMAFNKHIQQKTQELIDNMNTMLTQYKSDKERLQQAQKLLDTQVTQLSMEQLTSSYTPQVDVFETPELFMSRHNNYNVVDISLGLISHLSSGLLNQQPKLYTPKTVDTHRVLLI